MLLSHFRIDDLTSTRRSFGLKSYGVVELRPRLRPAMFVPAIASTHMRHERLRLLLRAPLAAGRAKVHQRSNMRIFHAHTRTHTRVVVASPSRFSRTRRTMPSMWQSGRTCRFYNYSTYPPPPHRSILFVVSRPGSPRRGVGTPGWRMHAQAPTTHPHFPKPFLIPDPQSPIAPPFGEELPFSYQMGNIFSGLLYLF